MKIQNPYAVAPVVSTWPTTHSHAPVPALAATGVRVAAARAAGVAAATATKPSTLLVPSRAPSPPV